MKTRNLIIGNQDSTDQRERDNLPTYQTARGNDENKAQAAGFKASLGIILILSISALYILVRFVEWISAVSSETSELDIWVIGAVKVAGGIFAVTVLVLLAYWLFNRAMSAGVVRLANNHPVSAYDIHSAWRRDRSLHFARETLDRFYSTEQVWAEHSDYASLNTLDRSGTERGMRVVKRPKMKSPAPAKTPTAPAELLELLNQAPVAPDLSRGVRSFPELDENSALESSSTEEPSTHERTNDEELPLTEEERLMILVSLREIGVTRERARKEYGISFTDSDWSTAGKQIVK